MSGRDYRQFIKLHRESSSSEHEETLKVLSKLADTNLTKFKQVRYDMLKGFIGERKVAAQSSLQKVKKLEECSKAKRELLFMKQHKATWFKEFNRLNGQAKKCQEDLDDFLKLIQAKRKGIEYADMTTMMNEDDEFDDDYYDDEDIKFINDNSHIDELEVYKLKLEQEVSKFKMHTLEPVYNLNEDLKYYLTVNPLKTIHKNSGKNDEILETIEQVREQQGELLGNLRNECLKYWNEIDDEANELQDNEFQVSEGIPGEAFLFDSPDEELKQSVLNEFLIIDFKYREKLTQLNENYQTIVNSTYDYDGWTQYEHELFQHIYEQYHYHNVNLTNCNFTLRDLMFDRMKRTFEMNDMRRTRVEFVKHEEWMNMKKYYNQQKKLIYNEWNESRKALLVKAEATFQEAFEMIELEREKKHEREKQARICNELYAKVKRFREQKLEALEIQQKLDRIMEEERKRVMKIENEREKKRREEQKKNINQYHERLESEKHYVDEKESERLDSIKNQLEKQALVDSERIEYRKKLLEERKVSLEQKRLAEKLENEEKEKKLEKFLESVKPNVDSDPARMMSYTLSELSRRGVNIADKTDVPLNKNDEKYSEKKQMYNVYSYTDKQLNNDARLRVEARLRQAGVINNDYAREVIKHVAPPTVPRRDMISNFKFDFDT